MLETWQAPPTGGAHGFNLEEKTASPGTITEKGKKTNTPKDKESNGTPRMMCVGSVQRCCGNLSSCLQRSTCQKRRGDVIDGIWKNTFPFGFRSFVNTWRLFSTQKTHVVRFFVPRAIRETPSSMTYSSSPDLCRPI